eukprot:TRINITY_DN238_c1_g3_i3.p1 TRINITY_DN238_c1_g3~~TRINITY_DN238_c1_g3_i3.p1  ORF type:complete len:419 (+),score=-70.00 TRINITY_DN238_c1_g3_i3:160-1257(+)
MNAFGQLGDGTTTDSLNATAVFRQASWDGLQVTAVAAGLGHTVALFSNGRLYSWGLNDHGQLGDGTTVTGPHPTSVVEPEAWVGLQVTAVTAGALHTIAILSNGILYAWGSNGNFQLGDGTSTDRLIPTAVARPPEWAGLQAVAISANFAHTVSLMSNGRVYAWGYNDYGQLGDGTRDSRFNATAVVQPAAWAGLKVKAVAACNYQTVALMTNGQLYSWGMNTVSWTLFCMSYMFRVLSYSLTCPNLSFQLLCAAPVHEVLFQQAVQLFRHCVDVVPDQLWCDVCQYHLEGLVGSCRVGAACALRLMLVQNGQLGDGTTTDRWTAVAVAQPAAWAGLQVTAIAAGWGHTIALLCKGASDHVRFDA